MASVRLLPFSDPVMEQDFRISYHNQRISADIFAAMVAVTLFLTRAFFSWESFEEKKLWTVFFVFEVLVIACTFHPKYAYWRLHITRARGALVATTLFFFVRSNIKAMKAPTFAEAAFSTLFELTRGKLLFLSATLYQISLTDGRIVLQTFLLAFMLAQAKEECAMMEELNPDLATFVSQLKQNYQLWERGGSGAACLDLCHNLLASITSSCTIPCRAALPLLWRIYGPPWAWTCILNRCIIGVTLGYIIPLGGLYIKEILERYEFARLKRLGVTDVGSSLRGNLPDFLEMVLRSVVTAAICFWGF